MTRAVLSTGANIGDSAAALASVRDALGLRLVGASPVYRSAPWGGVAQDDFLNQVVIAEDPTWNAADWLTFAQTCEKQAQRVRVQRWGPRTLDVDVITVDDIESDDPQLTLPHPRAHLRAFVLLPWLALDNTAQLPGHGAVAALLTALPAEETAEVVLV